MHCDDFVMGPRKKILLIDESSVGLMVGKMLLGRSVYDVLTARNGHEGLERAFAERPDLIVMSPGARAAQASGPRPSNACERLRENEGTRTTPILWITTRREGTVRSDGVSECERCDYVSKPIDGHELLTKVRSRLVDSGG